MSNKTTIRSRSPRGFWRCGVHFTPSGADFAEGEFTAEQWERLRNEPNLVVSAAEAKSAGKRAGKNSEGASSPDTERPATGQTSDPAGAATAPAGEATVPPVVVETSTTEGATLAGEAATTEPAATPETTKAAAATKPAKRARKAKGSA
jgi:hypothetical protein